jgi:hypothetical protein
MRSEKKGNSDSSYTIMIFKGSGKVKGLKISSRVVFWVFLFLVFYFIGSGAIIWEYLENRNASREYLGELDALRSQTGKMKVELFRARENIKMLEEHVYSLDEKSKKKTPPKTVSEKKPVPAKKISKQVEHKEETKEEIKKKSSDQKPQKEEAKQATESESDTSPGDQVDVRDFSCKKEGEKLSVVFNLTNVNKNKGPLSGYVHMLAFFGDSASTRVQTYPGVKVKDGVPVWYKAGYFFRIARFMPVKGEFNLVSDKETPSTIKVLVYDKSGELIFEKEYEPDLAD